MASILKVLTGAAELAAGIALSATGVGAGFGSSLALAGVGSLLASTFASPKAPGFSTTERHTDGPWEIIYGRTRVGGTLCYIFEWGQNNIILDMVVCLAAHPVHAAEQLLFNQGLIQIDTTALPHLPGGWTGNYPEAGSGSSYTPTAWSPTILTSIQRDANGLVTVSVPRNIPYLMAGSQVSITKVGSTALSATLNGTFTVSEIISQVIGGPGSIVFTVLNGGQATGLITSSGYVQPLWPTFGQTVYVEYLLGDQKLNESFVGQETGTPFLAKNENISPQSPQSAGPSTTFWGFFSFGLLNPAAYVPEQNPWTNACSFVGKSAAFLRLTYDSKIYAGGIPQISFIVSGKNDIYDPRLGDVTDPAAYVYTNNSALVIGDYLTNQTFGYRLRYGIDVPLGPLIDAANICDESITLLQGGSESRYTTNGKFTLEQSRGEILQGLLNSCAARLVVQGGQYVIYPGAWTYSSSTAVDLMSIATGPITWHPTSSMDQRFNSCKGTFISPDAKWTSTDFPAYQQDTAHGYTDTVTGDVLLTEDNGERRYLEMNLPFVTSVSQAQRIAKIALLRSRYSGVGTFPVNCAGYAYSPMDIMKVNASALSFSNQLLEVQSTRLKYDPHENSIGAELDLRTIDESIYAWSTEEQLLSNGFPDRNYNQYPSGINVAGYAWPWSPGYATIQNGDATYPAGSTSPASFGVQPIYGVASDGSATINLNIKGVPVINNLDLVIQSPNFFATSNTTGGSLVAGKYVVGISANDAGSGFSISDYTPTLKILTIPAGVTTGSITLSPIDWGSGDVSGSVYASDWNSTGQYEWHWNQALTVEQASATITSIDRSQAGGPDPLEYGYETVIQQVVHSGCWANQIVSVTSNTITIGGNSHTANLWAGYTLSLLSKQDTTVEIPILNMPIASNTASSGGTFVLTIGPNSNSVTLPNLTTFLAPLDVVVCRFNPTFTSTSFTDPNIANPFYPGGDTGVEAGHLAMCLSGVNAGDAQLISSVTGTGNDTINLVQPWTVTPSTGDIVVVCLPVVQTPYDAIATRTKAPSSPVVIASPDISNLAGSVWLMKVRTTDAEGKYGPDFLCPFREFYIYGGQGTRTIFANTTVLTNDGVLLCDATTGNITVQLLPVSTTPNIELLIKKVDSSSHTITVVPDATIPDTINGASSVVLASFGDYLHIKATG